MKKALKFTLTIMLIIAFSFLACISVQSWDYVFAKEKKAFTQSQLTHECENAYSEGEKTSKKQLLEEQLKYYALESDLNDMENELIVKENSINELTNQVTILNKTKQQLELQKFNLETQLNNYKQLPNQISSELYSKIEYYDETGTMVSVDYVNFNSEICLPNTLPNGTEINEWIVEYSWFDLANINYLNFYLDSCSNFVCEVKPSGTRLNVVTKNLKLKAVTGNVYDVELFWHNKLVYHTKANEGSFLTNYGIYTYDTCDGCGEKFYHYFAITQIEEQINGTWISVERFPGYQITNNTKVYDFSSILINHFHAS